MENKMYTKPQYKCGVCDKIYGSIAERMQCEATCLKKQEEETKRMLEIKKKEEQVARKAELDEAYEHFVKLYEAYLKDYDSHTYSAESIGKLEWPNIKSLFHFFM